MKGAIFHDVGFGGVQNLPCRFCMFPNFSTPKLLTLQISTVPKIPPTNFVFVQFRFIVWDQGVICMANGPRKDEPRQPKQIRRQISSHSESSDLHQQPIRALNGSGRIGTPTRRMDPDRKRRAENQWTFCWRKSKLHQRPLLFPKSGPLPDIEILFEIDGEMITQEFGRPRRRSSSPRCDTIRIQEAWRLRCEVSTKTRVS